MREAARRLDRLLGRNFLTLGQIAREVGDALLLRRKLLLDDLCLHGHDLATQGREVLVPRGYGRRAAPQQSLNDELH